MKTPEQIADDVLAQIDYGDDGTGWGAWRAADGFQSGWLGGDSLMAMLVAAIEADRAQRDESVHAAVAAALRERENPRADAAADWIDSEPDEFWEQSAEPLLDLLEDEHGANDKECDECHEYATNFWPNLKEPVQLCDSCTHNARRSGWEPGQ